MNLKLSTLFKLFELRCFVIGTFQGGVSDVVSVRYFGVRVSVMFHFMFVHYTFSSVGLL